LKFHRPVNYNVADHAAKIFRGDRFKEAARKVGKSAEAFQLDLIEALKRVVAEEQARELSDFEEVMALRALSLAIDKFSADEAA